jgi:NAD+ synthase
MPFMKIFIAQTSPLAGDLAHNFRWIEKYYRLALSENAELCILPELSTTGYFCEDLFLKKAFIKEVELGTRELISKIKNTVLFLPTPIQEDQKLYNGVLAIQNGRVIGKTFKHHLPNYGIFDEKRYFTSGVPQIIEVNGYKIGVPICEDIWHDDICQELAKKGASLLLVPNGSPYEIGKMNKRIELVKQRFSECKLPLIYCNQVLGQDGIVFDGRSFAYDGQTKHQMPIFDEDYQIISLSKGKFVAEPEGATPLKIEDEIYGAMVFGLRQYLDQNNIKSVVLGLSGGIDSALTAAIAVDAIGAENVKAVMMPSKYTSKESLIDAELVAKLLNINYNIHPIKSIINSVADKLGKIEGLAAENLQSRIRGLILMAISNSENRLLLTTGNKSEIATGYATLYGDMCGGFNPIKDLYKTQVFAVARFRNSSLPSSIAVKNKSAPIMPERVITKEPSAELRSNQKDSDSLPEYEILDKILNLYIEHDLGLNEIIEAGFDADIVHKVAKLVKSSEFKRRQSAPGIKISKRNFEKDYRYPISCNYILR